MIKPKTSITLQKMLTSLNTDNQAQYELPETIRGEGGFGSTGK